MMSTLQEISPRGVSLLTVVRWRDREWSVGLINDCRIRLDPVLKNSIDPKSYHSGMRVTQSVSTFESQSIAPEGVGPEDVVRREGEAPSAFVPESLGDLRKMCPYPNDPQALKTFLMAMKGPQLVACVRRSGLKGVKIDGAKMLMAEALVAAMLAK